MTRPLYQAFTLAILALGPTTAFGQQVLVKPYLQPGDGGALLGADVKVLAWLTDATPGRFSVTYRPVGGAWRTSVPESVTLEFAPAPVVPSKPSAATPASTTPKEPEARTAVTKPESDASAPPEKTAPLPPEQEQKYLKYTARLFDLPFNAEIEYRVCRDEQLVRSGTFRTRSTPDQPVKMALVGDMANGSSASRAIAFRIAEQKPDCWVGLGDLVYPTGRVNQYRAFFWPIYNDVDDPSPERGAPLMASAPFYPVLGNHDTAAKFPQIPDALGAYYFFHVPRNGPGIGPWVTSLGDEAAAAARFKARAADSYPALDVYSFDHGPVHVLVLSTNRSPGVDQSRLRAWVEKDLRGTRAPWKIVCCHAPGFHGSTQHYTAQTLRLWQPIFEAGEVDLVMAGHVHNYQRSRPLRFEPVGGKKDARGRVNGVFTIDRDFDGVNRTVPQGIIHIVAGGGGAKLYGPDLSKVRPALEKDHGANFADYTAKQVVDRNTFTVLEADPLRLKLRAIDADGRSVDEIVITQPVTSGTSGK